MNKKIFFDLLLFLSCMMIFSGDGFSSEDAEFKRLLRLAEQGDANAQFELGQMYCERAGLSRKAGFMYYNSKDVPHSYVKAYTWYSLASEQGHEGAKNNISILKEKMTPEQIDKAQKEAILLSEKINHNKEINDLRKQINVLEKKVNELKEEAKLKKILDAEK